MNLQICEYNLRDADGVMAFIAGATVDPGPSFKVTLRIHHAQVVHGKQHLQLRLELERKLKVFKFTLQVRVSYYRTLSFLVQSGGTRKSAGLSCLASLSLITGCCQRVGDGEVQVGLARPRLQRHCSRSVTKKRQKPPQRSLHTPLCPRGSRPHA